MIRTKNFESKVQNDDIDVLMRTSAVGLGPLRVIVFRAFRFLKKR